MRKVAFTLRQITRRKMVIYVKNFQLMSALVTSLDGKKPVFHAALALGQNPGIDNLANLVWKIKFAVLKQPSLARITPCVNTA